MGGGGLENCGDIPLPRKFFIYLNLANTFSTFHPQAAYGFVIKLTKFIVKAQKFYHQKPPLYSGTHKTVEY